MSFISILNQLTGEYMPQETDKFRLVELRGEFLLSYVLMRELGRSSNLMISSHPQLAFSNYQYFDRNYTHPVYAFEWKPSDIFDADSYSFLEFSCLLYSNSVIIREERNGGNMNFRGFGTLLHNIESPLPVEVNNDFLIDIDRVFELCKQMKLANRAKYMYLFSSMKIMLEDYYNGRGFNSIPLTFIILENIFYNRNSDNDITEQFRIKLTRLEDEGITRIRDLFREHFGRRKQVGSLITVMYDFRSIFVHGGVIDFENRYSRYRGYDEVRDFMIDLTKHLVLCYLEHHEFVEEIY